MITPLEGFKPRLPVQAGMRIGPSEAMGTNAAATLAPAPPEEPPE